MAEMTPADVTTARPSTPVALVHPSVESLAARVGVPVSESADGLGQMDLAVADAHGIKFAVLRHRYEPTDGTTIALLDRDVSPAAVDAVLDVLGVPQQERMWVMDRRDSTALAARYAVKTRASSRAWIAPLVIAAGLVVHLARRRSRA